MAIGLIRLNWREMGEEIGKEKGERCLRAFHGGEQGAINFHFEKP